MKAIAMDRFGGPEVLELRDLPRPAPEKGEVLIRVRGVGVNPVDWKIREGWLKDLFPHRFPLIPGWDVAGTVEELGEGVSRLRRGDAVWAYARKPVVQWGTYAEYVTLPERQVGLKPRALSFEEAGGVPLAALTAYQALFDAAGLQPGQWVLIHAAAGGVGHFAVQMARIAGAHIVATSGPRNQEFLRALGVHHPVDYTAQDAREAVATLRPEGVDVVLDCVGGQVLEASYDLVREGGWLVSIVDRPDEARAKERSIHAKFIFVEPNVTELDRIAQWVTRGEFRPTIQEAMPLERAAEAQEINRAGHVRGKLILVP